MRPRVSGALILPELPGVSVPKVLSAIKRPFATRVLRRWRELDAPILDRIGDKRGRAHFWQAGGGYDRNIFSREELNEKINYIHENPAKRGLVKEATDWPWSSARFYAGDERYVGPQIDRL